MESEIRYIGPDGQWHVARDGDTIPDGSTVVSGRLELNVSLADLPDYYYRQPDLPDANPTAGADIWSGDLVYFGSDGKVYPVNPPPGQKSIDVKGEIIKEDSDGNCE